MGIIEGTLVLQQGINAQQTACCHLLCDWQPVGAQNYLYAPDAVDGNGYITDPDMQITAGSRQVFGRDNRMGLLLGVRMAYGGGGAHWRPGNQGVRQDASRERGCGRVADSQEPPRRKVGDDPNH